MAFQSGLKGFHVESFCLGNEEERSLSPCSDDEEGRLVIDESYNEDEESIQDVFDPAEWEKKKGASGKVESGSGGFEGGAGDLENGDKGMEDGGQESEVSGQELQNGDEESSGSDQDIFSYKPPKKDASGDEDNGSEGFESGAGELENGDEESSESDQDVFSYELPERDGIGEIESGNGGYDDGVGGLVREEESDVSDEDDYILAFKIWEKKNGGYEMRAKGLKNIEEESEVSDEDVSARIAWEKRNAMREVERGSVGYEDGAGNLENGDQELKESDVSEEEGSDGEMEQGLAEGAQELEEGAQESVEGAQGLKQGEKELEGEQQLEGAQELEEGAQGLKEGEQELEGAQELEEGEQELDLTPPSTPSSSNGDSTDGSYCDLADESDVSTSDDGDSIIVDLDEQEASAELLTVAPTEQQADVNKDLLPMIISAEDSLTKPEAPARKVDFSRRKRKASESPFPRKDRHGIFSQYYNERVLGLKDGKLASVPRHDEDGVMARANSKANVRATSVTSTSANKRNIDEVEKESDDNDVTKRRASEKRVRFCAFTKILPIAREGKGIKIRDFLRQGGYYDTFHPGKTWSYSYAGHVNNGQRSSSADEQDVDKMPFTEVPKPRRSKGRRGEKRMRDCSFCFGTGKIRRIEDESSDESEDEAKITTSGAWTRCKQVLSYVPFTGYFGQAADWLRREIRSYVELQEAVEEERIEQEEEDMEDDEQEDAAVDDDDDEEEEEEAPQEMEIVEQAPQPELEEAAPQGPGWKAKVLGQLMKPVNKVADFMRKEYTAHQEIMAAPSPSPSSKELTEEDLYIQHE